MLSDISINRPLATLSMDRGSHGKADWLAAGQSTCTVEEEKRLKAFDYIDQVTWMDLTQSSA